MKHELVTSSNVESVGYDPESQELEVKFKNGGTYVYDRVPPEKHVALMQASSVGSHLHQHIKPHHGASRR